MEKITKEMLWRWLKKGFLMNLAILLIGLTIQLFLIFAGITLTTPLVTDDWKVTIFIGVILILASSGLTLILIGYFMEKIEEKVKR